MYLKTDLDGNVITREDSRNDFNRWKPLLPNATFTVQSKIKTPFGEIPGNTNLCNFNLN